MTKTATKAQTKQLKKAQQHHTKPARNGARKGATGHGIVRTERGEDQPADKKRARR